MMSNQLQAQNSIKSLSDGDPAGENGAAASAYKEKLIEGLQDPNKSFSTAQQDAFQHGYAIKSSLEEFTTPAKTTNSFVNENVTPVADQTKVKSPD